MADHVHQNRGAAEVLLTVRRRKGVEHGRAITDGGRIVDRPDHEGGRTGAGGQRTRVSGSGFDIRYELRKLLDALDLRRFRSTTSSNCFTEKL